MMQAVILAGGLGTRLRPLTENLPKTLLPVGDKPFLQHLLELLKSFRITEILLLVGYLGWKIEAYFGDGSKFGLEIDYAREETPLGTGGALKNASRQLRSEFLLLNGDTYLPIDYRALVSRYFESKPLAMLAALAGPRGTVPNNLLLDPAMCVLAYRKQGDAGFTHIDAGVSVFRKLILDLIPAGQVCSLELEIYPKLIRRRELRAFPTAQPFYDMGTLLGLETLQGVLL